MKGKEKEKKVGKKSLHVGDVRRKEREWREGVHMGPDGGERKVGKITQLILFGL